MIYLIVFIILVIIIFPNFWVKRTIKKHSSPLPDMPGTGAEFAEHLIKRFNLEGVKVEMTEQGGDHYSPHEKMVRLSPDNFDGKSVSAVTIAAHEVGHAIQYHLNEPITKLRQKYTPLAMVIEKLSIGLIALCPILIAIFKVPQIGLLSVFAGIIALTISILIQLIILPMEWDASFKKAYPIIEQGSYLPDEQLPAVKKILRAAAMTYVASTLSSLLSIWRWLAILKGVR
ncbi:MAG: Zn-dependent membrane protease YugP [Pseudohongiellaceae bacterium]|jgi:Zn-dependent membrane protease YugP